MRPPPGKRWVANSGRVEKLAGALTPRLAQQGLDLEQQAHLAVDLEASGHHGGDGLELSRDDRLGVGRAGADQDVGAARHGAVPEPDVDLPVPSPPTGDQESEGGIEIGELVHHAHVEAQRSLDGGWLAFGPQGPRQEAAQQPAAPLPQRSPPVLHGEGQRHRRLDARLHLEPLAAQHQGPGSPVLAGEREPQAHPQPRRTRRQPRGAEQSRQQLLDELGGGNGTAGKAGHSRPSLARRGAREALGAPLPWRAPPPPGAGPMNELEEGTRLALDFEKLRKVGAGEGSVVPVVLQHAETGEVLYVAYANRQALQETLAKREAVLWSTSRNELWHKGATSGDTLRLVDVRVNCEQNSLLYRVVPKTGGVCHTKDAAGRARETCYYRKLESEEEVSFL